MVHRRSPVSNSYYGHFDIDRRVRLFPVHYNHCSW